ncbi:zinc finger protein, putative [Ixodes scapularis]|uniref:Zinc finger protein, putative n=1 Tax=Ixodes scapularis TaxID=6945 RepID=B7QAQ6_IXOSC|nr:zinc finger protein, putative [Ixodes scapularis]|eukprot:XP_002412632.1 zinc finger protein, putative [Ixodes scapularis]
MHLLRIRAESRAILFPAAVGLFPCDDCGGQFSSQTFLSAHCKSAHAEVEPPEMGLLRHPSCPYATRSEYDTANHRRLHPDERPFVAQKRTLSEHTFLSAHCKSAHVKVEPPEVGLLRRPSRPYTTRSKYDTVNHERLHPDERPFVAQKRTLSEHIKTHSGVRPYGCGVCGDTFVQKSELHSHKRKHMGKSLYVCEECGQGFCRLGDLFMHEDTHAKDCPYVCFSSLAYLNRHRKMRHLPSEGRHRCRFCPYSNHRRYNVISHERSHSGEKPYNCQFCGKAFNQRGNLLRHCRTYCSAKR